MSTVATGEFTKVPLMVHICDWCNERKSIELYFNYKWNDGYDHYGHEVEFCSLECFQLWLKDNTTTEEGAYTVFPHGELVTITGNSSLVKDLLGINL
jgi:hypothetical protein